MFIEYFNFYISLYIELKYQITINNWHKIKLMLLNKLNKVLYQIININLILSWEIMKKILFVIIYGLMGYKYLKNGRINNIRIQSILILNIMEFIILILQMLWNTLYKDKYQIKNIIIILTLKMKIKILWHIILKMNNFLFLMNGIMMIWEMYPKIQILFNRRCMV